MVTPPLNKIEVVAPNLNRRLSGVTSTIARLVPLQAKKIGIVSYGPGLPEYVPRLSTLELLRLGFTRTENGRPRVFHARRNVEMLLGLTLKHLLRHRYKLLFTSASQRDHSAYTRFLIRRMDHVVATSNAGAKYLKVPNQVVYHGINTEDFSPADNKMALIKMLDLDASQKWIGCIGRVRKQKGTDVFVDAMLKILPDHPDWSAVILGRATEQHVGFQNELKARVEAAGLSKRIIFAGEVPVDQIVDYYRILSLFIAPQRWEGFGLTPLEAMACGVPVVATKVGAFPELILENETGHLIDAGDIDEMVAASLKIIDHPQKQAVFSKKSREHMVKSFDINREADRLIEIYLEMAKAL